MLDASAFGVVCVKIFTADVAWQGASPGQLSELARENAAASLSLNQPALFGDVQFLQMHS